MVCARRACVILAATLAMGMLAACEQMGGFINGVGIGCQTAGACLVSSPPSSLANDATLRAGE